MFELRKDILPLYSANTTAPPTTPKRAMAMAPAFDAAKANLRGAAALDWEVLELLALVVLLELEVVVSGLVAVVPNPVVVVAGVNGVVVGLTVVVVEDEDPVVEADADVDVDEDVDVVETELTGPMEKEPLVAKTLVMLPMSTASSVYPDPAGTMGNSSVIVPVEGSTLLAMAKSLRKSTLTSSSDQVDGSPAALDQVIVATPPEVRPVGVLIVSALIKGARRSRELSLENIFEVVKTLEKTVSDVSNISFPSPSGQVTRRNY